MLISPETRTWAEIDLAAIRHNAETARSLAKGESELMAVIKANAYGHGAVRVAQALREIAGAYAVANLEEARELAEAAITKDILILSPSLPGELEGVIAGNFIGTVSNLGEVRAYGEQTGGRMARVNFKIDTGMGRIGCWQDQAIEVLREIAKVPGVEIAHISTHLTSADDDEGFTHHQLEEFRRLRPDLKAIAPQAKIHCLNSAGTLGFGAHDYDYLRVGLALYGIAIPEHYQDLLRPALTWKTRIILIRDVEAGHPVSYGRTFIAPHLMQVATLPVGYADGFPRQASNRDAFVLIGGIRCPVIGRVTMDQILVDVSGVPTARVGDEAVVIGSQGAESLLATELAQKAGTIPWHIFTGLGNRVHRHYKN